MAKRKTAAAKGAKKPVKKPAKKPAQTPAKKLTKKPVKKSVNKPAKKPASKSTKRPAKPVTKKLAQKKPLPKKGLSSRKAAPKRAAKKVAPKKFPPKKAPGKTATKPKTPVKSVKPVQRTGKTVRMRRPAPRKAKPPAVDVASIPGLQRVAAAEAVEKAKKDEDLRFIHDEFDDDEFADESEAGAAPSRPIFVFVGPPGVGKGTQAALLAADLHLPHISTGDLFRDHLKRDTELGRKAKSYMNSGQLVPDELVVALVKDRTSHEDCASGFILDGFPRTIDQDAALTKGLIESGDRVAAVMYFDAPRDVIIERISGRRTCRACGAISHAVYSPTKVAGVCDACGGETYQREDDGPEKVRARLDVYDAQTGPLVPYYRGLGLLREFDARGSAEQIYLKLRQTVADALKQQGAGSAGEE